VWMEQWQQSRGHGATVPGRVPLVANCAVAEVAEGHQQIKSCSAHWGCATRGGVDDA